MKKYPIKLDKETMRELAGLLLWYHKKYPIKSENLTRFEYGLRDVLDKGCFIHSTMTETFKTSRNSKETICKKCTPKKYKELKEKVKP